MLLLWRSLSILLASSTAARAATSADGDCRSWSDPQAAGALPGDSLQEVSGAAASRASPGLLWMHEDSGGAAVIYGVDTAGQLYGSFALPGAENDDWEDIALGPCPDWSVDCACLFVGDIGGDGDARSAGVVYRFGEPSLDAEETAAPETLHFRYEDGAHDAEALVVDGAGRVFLLTKSDDGVATLFQLPGSPPEPTTEDAPLVATAVGSVDLSWLDDPAVTGADLSPGGRWLAVRTDADLLLFDATDGVAAALDREPVVLPAPADDGGSEAVAFDPEGDRIYLVAEAAGATVWQVTCADGAYDALANDALADCPVAEDDGCGCSAGGLGGGLLALALAVLGVARRRD